MNLIIFTPAMSMLYTLPMNINGYVSFLINTLDTIVSELKYAN